MDDTNSDLNPSSEKKTVTFDTWRKNIYRIRFLENLPEKGDGMSSFNKEAWRVARSANKYMIEV